MFWKHGFHSEVREETPVRSTAGTARSAVWHFLDECGGCAQRLMWRSPLRRQRHDCRLLALGRNCKRNRKIVRAVNCCHGLRSSLLVSGLVFSSFFCLSSSPDDDYIQIYF